MGRTAASNVEADILLELKDPTVFEGSPVTVGTTAVELTFTITTRTVSIQSDPDNTGIIWLGASNVDSSGSNAIKQLKAGDSIDLDMNDATAALYAVSNTATQTVYKLALT